MRRERAFSGVGYRTASGVWEVVNRRSDSGRRDGGIVQVEVVRTVNRGKEQR
jgi:hypothetical protein